MIEYDKFNMDLTFQDSKAEIGKDYAFTGLDVLEVINQIPYFELGLESTYLSPIEKEKNIVLKYQSDNLNYESTLGINSIVYDGYSILIRGWMTKWEDFKVAKTRFLGKNIKDALEKLKIRDTINYSDNLIGDIFQINETNYLQCLSICTAGAKTPYWSVGRYSINLDEPKEEVDTTPLTGGRVLVNTLDTSSLLSSPSPQYWFETDSFRNRYSIEDYDNRDQFKNLLKNKKLQEIGMKYFMISDCSREYEWPVGTKITNKNDLYPEVSSWVVVSSYYHYRKASTSTNVQYGGLI